METGDLFGLHRRWRIDDGPVYVLVYPRVRQIAAAPITSRRPVGEIKIAHRIYEDPVRISGIRDYVPGDSLRRVHWKATARTGRLQCKVFEPSVMVGATLVLDFHEDAYADQQREERSELAVTLTASLAHYIYRNRQQVGLLSNGRDASDRIRLGEMVNVTATRRHAELSARPADRSERLRPVRVETRRGQDQAMRIFEALARIELTDGLSFVELLDTERGLLPRDAAVTAIVSRVSPEIAQALASLARSGWHVVVFIVADEESANRGRELLCAHRLPCHCLTHEADIADLSLI